MDTQAESSDDHSRASGAHSPSSCTSVCHDLSTLQEPRLMVVRAVTKNFKTQTSELVTVFLDSGSQYSFICTTLAKHLGLTFRNTRTVTTLTFGGHELTEESSEITLTPWDQYEHPIQLVLWTREKITTVLRTNDRIDNTIVDPAGRVDVDVLIGIDNYCRVVDLHRNERLPSGLILSHTRFGPVLSGIQHPVVSNSLSTAHTSSDEDEPENERLVRSLFGLGMDEGEDVDDAEVIKQFYNKVAIVDGSIYEMSDFHSQVPRYLGVTCDNAYDLVLCSDASKRVYATAVYILTRHANDSPRPTLLFAKAKLAPPGAITIPRMELLACHMAAKTAKFLRSQCKVSFQSVRFLTDSQTVLYWIQSRKPLKTYVASRVRYIRRVLDELRADNIATGFYYLNTDNNPADCATRGLTAIELQNHIWWTGPSFFAIPSSQWPWKSLEPSVSSLPGAEAEELKAVTTSTNTISEPYVSFVPFTRTNSYTKLVRVTAYVLKFLARVRHLVETRCHREHQDVQSILGTMDITPVVTPDDFTTAESLLIREHYREGQQQLDSPYIKKFRTMCDKDGIIRVDRRMSNAQNDNSTNPILILSDHPLCYMLIIPLFPVNSSDPDTNVAIRPIDLITTDFQVARLTGSMPQKIANATNESYRALRTRYKSQLWHSDYLDALAQRQIVRSNGQSSRKPPRVGEVVFIRQDAHRSTWPLALILELNASSDGNVRSAKIRTAKKKILERSINRLVPLEIVADDDP
ncbi:unnamed protein product [Cylicocyclus nassatus]|uniref:DUF5641 domain-containing protein n=1 Tax=Cylicocyclus nassatus TaxID=53992 RepID=A0AA36DLC2_CYLNA|nr:unnamed protein product [Cylicocyclus nassatus]